MRIYNVKEISILKSLISQFNAEKLGYFHCSIKAPRLQKILGMFPVQLYFKSTVIIYISFTITAIIGGNARFAVNNNLRDRNIQTPMKIFVSIYMGSRMNAEIIGLILYVIYRNETNFLLLYIVLIP